MVHLRRAAILGLLVAAAANAQVTTKKFQITLGKGVCDSAHPTIRVVVNSDETDYFDATRVANTCVWEGTHEAGTLDPELLHFSLRLGVARTGCQQGQANEVSRVGTLTFKAGCCGTEPPRQIAINPVTNNAHSPIEISYLRLVSGRSADSTCKEHGFFTGLVPRELMDVQFSIEEVVLQLGREKPDPNASGLWIDEAMLTRADENGGRLSLPHDEVLKLQLFQAQTRGSHYIEEQKLDLDDRIRLAKLKTLELRVKK
jgi:hypothetical protein